MDPKSFLGKPVVVDGVVVGHVDAVRLGADGSFTCSFVYGPPVDWEKDVRSPDFGHPEAVDEYRTGVPKELKTLGEFTFVTPFLSVPKLTEEEAKALKEEFEKMSNGLRRWIVPNSWSRPEVYEEQADEPLIRGPGGGRQVVRGDGGLVST